MGVLSDWFFKGLGLSSLSGLASYVFGLVVNYEPTWSRLEVFITLFGTGFMIASIIYVVNSIKVDPMW